MNTKIDERKVVVSDKEGTWLDPIHKPMFDDVFLRMLALRLHRRIEEELPNNKHVHHLVELIILIMQAQIYMREHDGLVSWFNNQMTTEAVGDATKEIKWEIG